jgi:hypothetical protein
LAFNLELGVSFFQAFPRVTYPCSSTVIYIKASMSGSSDEEPHPEIISEGADLSVQKQTTPWSLQSLLQIPFILMCLTVMLYIQGQRESVIWERIQTLERVLDQHQAEAGEIFRAAKGVQVTKTSDGKLGKLLEEAVSDDTELAMSVRQTNKRATEFQDRLTKVLRGLGEGLLDLRKRTTPDKGMTLQGFESSQLPTAWEKLEELKSRVNGFNVEDLSHSVNRLKGDVKETFQEVWRLGAHGNQRPEQSGDVANAIDRLKSMSATAVSDNIMSPRAAPQDLESHIALDRERADRLLDNYRGYDLREPLPLSRSDRGQTQHGPQPVSHMLQTHQRPMGFVESSEYMAPKHVRPTVMEVRYPETEELAQNEAPPYEPEPPQASMHWVQEPDARESFGHQHWVQDYGYGHRHHAHYHSLEDPPYPQGHWVQDWPEYEHRPGHWVEESSFIQAKDAKSRPRVPHHKMKTDSRSSTEMSDEGAPKN